MSEQVETITVHNKLLIGVTGNIATGKSVLLRLAAEREALIIDADQIVHELMDHDADLQAAIAVAFGSKVRRENGRIDRRALGQIVFEDTAAMQDLEQIVHPRVRIEIAHRLQDSDATIIFLEAIKLLEGSLASICHQIWVSRCPRQRQLERLMICRGMDSETAVKRIEMQSPQEEKVAQADVVIDTAGLMRDTEAQFRLGWGRLPNPETVDPITLEIPVTSVPESAPEEASAETPEEAPPQKPAKEGKGIGIDRPIPKSLKQKLGKSLPSRDEMKPPAAKPEGEAAAEPEPLQETKAEVETATPTPELAGEDVNVRRARPSDIPSIILLIHKASDGEIKLKRSDMLMAFGERSYLIGQIETDIQAILGWNIENLVARIDQLYLHPATAVDKIGAALLESVEESANKHICEIIVIFLPIDGPDTVRTLFTEHGFGPADLADMPATWRTAIKESQPENTDFLIKVLRERVTHPM